MNNQREGSKSNAEVGSMFEQKAKSYLDGIKKISLSRNYSIEIGIQSFKKSHRFDLGSPELLVECKSHRWTKGKNVPSAKMTVWTEAMYYFHLAPKKFDKIFFFEKSLRDKNEETLGAYYLRTHGHLVPIGVEFWEYDPLHNKHQVIT